MKEINLGVVFWVAIVATLIAIVIPILFASAAHSPLINTSDNRVCVLGHDGTCAVDITADFKNASSDRGRDCDILDRYYETTRYICVKSVNETDVAAYRNRGATDIVETYFTEIDGNTYILDKGEIPDLKPGHLYNTVALTQAGYCRGPSKLIRVTEINASCDGGSDCHGIPMGWVNGSRVEACA
jgi:hypothetical protein